MKNISRLFGGALAILLLISCAQLPVQLAKGAQEDKLVADKAYWIKLAGNAWQYFQPGVGVNSKTGLHHAGLTFDYFTFWDLGVYINAILDAQDLGLISKSGVWGADYRVDKIIDWLNKLQLAPNNVPYLWYNYNTGEPGLSVDDSATNVYDYGCLLVALHRLKSYRPDLIDTIDYTINTRFNTSMLASGVTIYSDYTYYIARGFDFFGYNSTGIVNSLNLLNYWQTAEKIDVYGILLPKATLTCEPLLLSFFSFEPDPLLTQLVYNVYLAHEARYNATGKFTAMSEGNTGLLQPPHYVYESPVAADGSTWVMWPEPIDSPIIYLKTAVSFLSLYNTPYAQKMVSYLEPRLLTYGGLFVPACGYMEGIDENGRVVETSTDKTNGLILTAANYAIKHKLAPELSPSPSLSPTSKPTEPVSSSNASTSIQPTATPVSSPYPDYLDQSESYLTTLGAIFISGCLVLSLLITIHSRRKATKLGSNKTTTNQLM